MNNLKKETALAQAFTNVPTAFPEQTVREVLTKLRRKREWDFTYYIYIVDKNNTLKGVISLNKLIRSDSDIKMQEIMSVNLVTVHPSTDQEHVAILAIKNNIRAVPVVSKKTGEFLGVVGDDRILRILHQEHTEDFLLQAGVMQDQPVTDIFKARVQDMVKLRIPWLLIGLAGGMLASSLVGAFQATLEQELTVAFFIPVIVYMSGAVGSQTQTLFIRSLVLRKTSIMKYVTRELGVNLSIGVICSVIAFLFTYIWLRNIHLASTIGLAMFLNICLATFISLAIPYILYRFKKDPAIGAGPFITVVQDIMSILIYFVVATIIIL